jgi:deazaflavin-dependent oxidoreductase (nitroreductase family)
MAEQKKWVWKTPPWVPGHIERYLTDPEGAHLWDASVGGVQAMLPTLLLTTIGRKSGEPRHSPLLYQPTGDAYVIIGSKGGFPSDPAWYLNLMANKEAEIRVGAKHLKVRARVAEGEERAKLWAQMRESYPPFDEYQERAKDREIPVVVLDPI